MPKALPGSTCSGKDWLRHFCAEATFFQPCPRCSSTHSHREATTNFYCMETGAELCSVCVQGKTSENTIQVRRSSYHDVVRACDMAKLADVSGIQSYTINGARVLFLRRRPQPRPPKGAVGASQCSICSRHLQDVSLYCSLQCKLDGLEGCQPVPLHSHTPHLLAASDSSASPTGSHVGPETPSHLRALRALDSSSNSDADSTDDMLSTSSRRKGHPLRAPLY